MKLSQDEIIKVLLKEDYILPEDVEKAKQEGKANDVVGFLLQEDMISRSILGEAIAEGYGFKFHDLSKGEIKDFKLEDTPEELVAKNVYVVKGKKEYEVYTPEPENYAELEPLLKETFKGKKFIKFFVFGEDLTNFLRQYRKPLAEEISAIIQKSELSTPEVLLAVVNAAYDYHSSDIHMEPQFDKTVKVRFRIDGLFRWVTSLDMELYQRLLNHIKVLAKMKLDEHFRTQDGAIRIEENNRSMNLRISIIPTVEGEKCAIRVLSDSIRNLSLTQLGMSEEDQQTLEKALDRKHGMILNTGPTGSGKTTTLYGVLQLLHTSNVNITTIEDPVEYRIPGINQIQVNEGHEVTFARGLRSIVRQDPDIILVGEVRDTETAEIAINAALTGHQMLSTFHANDTATTIPRLLDMGIEPFLLSSTINLIIAQRLVRKVCTSCMTSYSMTRKELDEKIPKSSQFFKGKKLNFYKGKGCKKCNQSGFSGRVAIFELLYISDEMRKLIDTSPSGNQIWELARKEGTKSFFEDGAEKVRLGQTTIEELLRVAPVTYN